MTVPALDLGSLIIISMTLNVCGGVCWLVEALRQRCAASVPPQCRCGADGPPHGAADTPISRINMYRLVDLVVGQCLAVYGLFLLLWLPLVTESFQPASAEVVRLTLPAVCVSTGRHIFCSLTGWRSGRGAISSCCHVLSAVLQLAFLQSRRVLVLAVLALLTELGGVYGAAAAVAGPRPAWPPPLRSAAAAAGLACSLLFSGLAYLVVLALTLARCSPLLMPPSDVALFFGYVAFSFIANTYTIYLAMVAFCTGLLEARAAAVAAAEKRTGPAGLPSHPPAPPTGRGPSPEQRPPARCHGSDGTVSDGDLLLLNMV